MRNYLCGFLLLAFSAPILAEGQAQDLNSSQCSIRLQINETRKFNSQFNADSFCDDYRQTLSCKTFERGYNDWDSVISFDEIFKSNSRRDTYRLFFDALEQRGLYSLPFNFKLNFDCKNG